MLGFAWSELVLIGAVALVVIGPKDLPKVMRTMGQWSRKARLLATDFQHHIDEMVRQAELEETRREAEKAMDFNSIGREIEEAVDAPGLEKALALDETPAASPEAAAPAETSAPAEIAASAPALAREPEPTPKPPEPSPAAPTTDAARETAP